MFCTVLGSFLGWTGEAQMRMRNFSVGANAIYRFACNSLERISVLGLCLPFCTAVHREMRIWPDKYWPDAAPRQDFRNLWFAATGSDTGIAGVDSGLR